MEHSALSDEKVKHYMDMAFKQARDREDKRDFPIGAVVVHMGEDKEGKEFEVVLGEDHNRVISCRHHLAHAEVLAMQFAETKYDSLARMNRKFVLFTTLEPCFMCVGSAMSFGVSEVYYPLKASGDGSVIHMNEWKPSEETQKYYKVPQCKRIDSHKEETIALLKEYLLVENRNKNYDDWINTIIRANDEGVGE